MDISAPASVSTVPRHTADLRPTADAAALARQPQPNLPLGPAAVSQPPQSSQVAAISRAMLAISDSSEFPPLKAPLRVLKPYGIQMLPHRPDEPRDGQPAGREDVAKADVPSPERDPAPEPFEGGPIEVSADKDDAVRLRPEEASEAA